MTSRIVNCVKLGRDLPGLETPPFPGELGIKIYENISASAWQEWSDKIMIKVINEYRLNLIDPDHYQILLDQMMAFLNLDEHIDKVELDNPDRASKVV